MQRLFNWAVELELVSVNPFARLTRPRLGSRRRVLSRAELVKLLRRSLRDFRAFLLAARETGARPQELRCLAWQDLQLPDGVSAGVGLQSGQACFVLNEFKARARRADAAAVRLIPVTPRLGRLLARLLTRHGSPQGFVFRTRQGKPWSSYAVRCRMTRLRIRAGMPPQGKAERVCLYTQRHTAATNWVAAGMDIALVQKLLGHTNVRTTLKYVHLSNAAILRSWGEWLAKRA